MVKGNNRIEKGRRRGGWKEFGSGTRRRPVQRDYGAAGRRKWERLEECGKKRRYKAHEAHRSYLELMSTDFNCLNCFLMGAITCLQKIFSILIIIL